MIQVVQAEDRNFNDLGWLKTFWLFSFSDYYDPDNISHGRLRVFNDDIVQPQTGFGTHPHEEMEIVSIVLEGEMTHTDTMGNEMVVRENDVQRMTAGTGLHHSEWNFNNKPVAFFQIWILPDKNGLEPSYDQLTFNPEEWGNNFSMIASDGDHPGVVTLNSEASIYRSRLDSDVEISYEVKSGYCQFLYVINGKVMVNGIDIGKRDQARIRDERLIAVKAHSESDFILVEVPER